MPWASGDGASDYESDEEDQIAKQSHDLSENVLLKNETTANSGKNMTQSQECRKPVSFATYRQALDAEMRHINEQVEQNILNGVRTEVPETDTDKLDCVEQLKGAIMNTIDTDDEWKTHCNKKGIRTRTMPFTRFMPRLNENGNSVIYCSDEFVNITAWKLFVSWIKVTTAFDCVTLTSIRRLCALGSKIFVSSDQNCGVTITRRKITRHLGTTLQLFVGISMYASTSRV